MKYLIPTEPDDTHAILVKLALEKLGHQVTLIFTADQPTRQKNSVFIDITNYRWQSSDRYESILDNDYDVVWWRRARKPYLPKEISHPDDYKFLVRENTLFYESFTHNMAPNAWWINPKEAANRANFKLLQLKIASECGMTIPTTLCSNDPEEIHDFVRKHEALGVIYKPLCANVWFEKDHTKIVYTSRISCSDLPTNQALQHSPGIFQKEVKKKYELRVTCFGDYLVAAKLNSQVHADGLIDWRAIRSEQMAIEPYDLPEAVANKIRKFMRTIGIVFGSFDFIVTPEGDYIFLEVNEQGQFLWIEEYNPSFKMLDIFIQFLMQKRVDFKWDSNGIEHSIQNYRDEIDLIYTQNMHRHIDLNRANAW
jgi:glutathione synthase/RimK-type ligase-like ATP-grasp enzyme